MKTVAVRGASGAVADHLGDGRSRAWADTGTASGAVVRLHQARVDNAIVGGWGADAALALLHDNGKNETVVNASVARKLLDSAVDVGNLLGRVVLAPAVPSTRSLHERHIGVPDLVIRTPLALRGPAGIGRAISSVEPILVSNASSNVRRRHGREGSSDGRERDSSKGELAEHFDFWLVG